MSVRVSGVCPLLVQRHEVSRPDEVSRFVPVVVVSKNLVTRKSMDIQPEQVGDRHVSAAR